MSLSPTNVPVRCTWGDLAVGLGEQGVRWLSPEALGSEPIWTEILHFVRNAPEAAGVSPPSPTTSQPEADFSLVVPLRFDAEGL